ncbi:MAG TPA: diguanylate cyclase [Longimicrobiales bacterium]|nr:diguanylate cyclase [Longimicrobiales bacterium]
MNDSDRPPVGPVGPGERVDRVITPPDSPGTPGLSGMARQRDVPRPHSPSPVIRFLDRLGGPVIVTLAVLLIALVGGLDYATGSEMAFSAFYLLPIALVAWSVGRSFGLAFAMIGALVWLTADLSAGHVYSRTWVPYWNSGIRLLVFIVVAVTVSGMRRLWLSEHKLARTDQLTGAQNGRAFYDLVELEMSRALRYERPFTLAYLDVDDFKAVNDAGGHNEGDRLLRRIVHTIRSNIRSMDAIARLGGDEFAILLPETGPGAADVALRKIQHRLLEMTRSEAQPVGFSIGAIVCVGPPESADRLIGIADQLMYEVKRGGKNGLRIETLDDNFTIEAILQRG